MGGGRGKEGTGGGQREGRAGGRGRGGKEGVGAVGWRKPREQDRKRGESGTVLTGHRKTDPETKRHTGSWRDRLRERAHERWGVTG